MPQLKYSIGQQVAIKAAQEQVKTMQIMHEIANALDVDVRTVYNYINIPFDKEGIQEEKLNAIAKVLGVDTDILLASTQATPV